MDFVWSADPQIKILTSIDFGFMLFQNQQIHMDLKHPFIRKLQNCYAYKNKRSKCKETHEGNILKMVNSGKTLDVLKYTDFLLIV